MSQSDFADSTVKSSFEAPISELIKRRYELEQSAATANDPSGSLPCPPAGGVTQNGLNLPSFTEDELKDHRLLRSAALEIYRMRRARDRVLPAGLTGEPSWDILIALYAEGPGELTVSSLYYGAGVSPTTAMRWVAALGSQGLVKRTRHPRDGRLILCSLTEKGRLIVEQSLRAMLRSWRP